MPTARQVPDLSGLIPLGEPEKLLFVPRCPEGQLAVGITRRDVTSHISSETNSHELTGMKLVSTDPAANCSCSTTDLRNSILVEGPTI